MIQPFRYLLETLSPEDIAGYVTAATRLHSSAGTDEDEQTCSAIERTVLDRLHDLWRDMRSGLTTAR